MAYRHSTTREPAVITDAPIATVPTGVAIDDIIVLIGSADGTNNNWGALPAGFTHFTGSPANQSAPDGQTSVCCWKRAAAADTGTYNFGLLTASAAWIVQAYAFSGRHITNPPVPSTVVINTTANASPISVTANGLTALDGDDLLWLAAPDVNAVTLGNGMAPPSTFIERQDAESTIAGQEWQNISGATKDNVSAGATGSITGTFSLTSGAAGYVAWLIRIPALPSDVVQGFGLALEIG